MMEDNTLTLIACFLMLRMAGHPVNGARMGWDWGLIFRETT